MKIRRQFSFTARWNPSILVIFMSPLQFWGSRNSRRVGENSTTNVTFYCHFWSSRKVVSLEVWGVSWTVKRLPFWAVHVDTCTLLLSNTIKTRHNEIQICKLVHCARPWRSLPGPLGCIWQCPYAGSSAWSWRPCRRGRAQWPRSSWCWTTHMTTPQHQSAGMKKASVSNVDRVRGLLLPKPLNVGVRHGDQDVVPPRGPLD